MIPLGVDHFGKSVAWSLIYFLIYAYFNILAQSQILVISLYNEMFSLISMDQAVKSRGMGT